jgi:transforming growth factor-beta-induced protein
MRKLSLSGMAALIFALAVFSVLPVAGQDGGILDVARADPNFSTLALAVEAADPTVLEALSGPGPLTLFAPTNLAFNNLASFLGMPLDDLLDDEAVITQLLLYHVVQGNIFSSQIMADATVGETRLLPTLLTDTAIGVTVTEDARIVLNGIVNVTEVDLPATNGVIHIIDNVLLHRVITDQIDASLEAPADEPAEDTPDNVFLRVVHLSPDAPAVDVLVDGEIALAGLAFGEIGDWLILPAGRYEIAVTAAGAGLDEAVIAPSEFGLLDGWFMVAAVGSVEAGTLAVVTITGDPSPDDETNARMTILHAITGGVTVDIIDADGSPLFSDLSYMEFQTLDIPAGVYDLAAVPAGRTRPVVLALSDMELEAGGFYFAAGVGTPDDTEVVLAVTDAETIAELRGEPVAAAAVLSLVDTLAVRGNFTILLAAVEAADPAILEALEGPGPLTVFAPTDQAFRNLLSTLGVSADDALQMTDLVTSVLLYHVARGAVRAADLLAMDTQSVPTLLADNYFRVDVADDDLTLNRVVTIIERDIAAQNGVIHIIDNVLLPQAVIMQIQAPAQAEVTPEAEPEDD